MADVMALNQPTKQYDESPLYSMLGGLVRDNNYGYGVNQNISNYIAGLDPETLLQRYQHIGQGNRTLNDYYKAAYGISDPGNVAEDYNYQAYQSLRSLLGREPTSNELVSAIPAFQGPNGLINGRAYVASLQQQYKSNPQMDPGNPMNNQKPEDVSTSVNQQFQSILGRAPTTDELQHFSQAISAGQVDAYGLGSFLKQMPEYTNAQDKTFRSNLAGELQGYDQSAFNRMKGDVYADYAARGFQNSPSLDYALTDMMGKIAENRGNYLANLSSQQYGGNKDLAIGNYQNSLNQMYQNSQSQRQQQSQYANSLLNRGYEGADYTTQKNDYMDYLSKQPQYKPSVFDYINAGANVARGIGSLYTGGK